MPWVIRKNDKDEFCLYRQGPDGEATGESRGCHATEAEAKQQMAALYVHAPDAKAVKFAEGSDEIVEGAGMPWGGPFNGRDLDQQYFSGKTDFAFDWFGADARPLLWHHGLDADAGTSVVGRVKSWEVKTDLGVWTRAQLDKQSKYFAAIKEMITAGKLYFSSGAMAHLVDVDSKTGEIKRWPWIELSLTPTPSNLLATVDMATATRHYKAAGLDIPETIKTVWTTEAINDLPDAAFLYVAAGGEKDEQGKTVPRSLRHFPVRNSSGEIDLPHLRNALARIPQSALSQDIKDRCIAKARRLAEEVGIEVSEETKAVDLTTLSIVDHASIVANYAASLAGRTKDLQQRRVKEGRVISTVNRSRLAECLTQMKEAVDALQTLLDSTDPAKAEAKAAQVRRLRAQIEATRLHALAFN